MRPKSLERESDSSLSYVTVRYPCDRVAQMTMLLVIGPIFEEDLFQGTSVRLSVA
jgi:hypothetical protein